MQHIRFINAVILGYVLTFSGIILNYLDGNKHGVGFALAGIAFAYILEVMENDDFDFPMFKIFLFVASVISVASSLSIYLFT